MNKLICIIFVSFFLSSCFLRVHKMDIEQGNLFSETQVAQLHKGMSMEEVKTIMGNPVLVNLFTPNRASYVYTFQPGYQKMHVKRVECIFYHDRLQEIIVSET